MTAGAPSLSKMFPNWSREQIDLIKRTVAQGTTDDEFMVFLYTCKHTGLDPLLRQIYAVKRNEGESGEKKMSIQTGIDGYRLIADRTGKYAGSDDPSFEYHPVDVAKKSPVKATVTVYKIVGNQRVAFTASARMEEYKPGGRQAFMWTKMPHGQLAKCAEALALRKAFPAELAQVRTDDEMQQADWKDAEPVQRPQAKQPEAAAAAAPTNGAEVAEPSAPEQEPLIAEGQVKYLRSMIDRHKIEGFEKMLQERYKIERAEDIKLSWYADIASWVADQVRLKRT